MAVAPPTSLYRRLIGSCLIVDCVAETTDHHVNIDVDIMYTYCSCIVLYEVCNSDIKNVSRLKTFDIQKNNT